MIVGGASNNVATEAHQDADRWMNEGGSVKPRAALALGATNGEEIFRMQFEIYQDNSGQFHWRLVGDDGIEFAVSVMAFDSRQEARWAASDVHLRAGLATGAGR